MTRATDRKQKLMTHNAKLVRRRFGRNGITIALTAVILLAAGGILLLALT